MSSHDRKKTERAERLAAILDAAEQTKTLESWNAFIETMKIPVEVYPAIVTGRPELLQPRAMSAEESAVLYELVSNLIRTNVALREHSQELAKMVEIWGDAFTHLASLGIRIEAFANFQSPATNEEQS